MSNIDVKELLTKNLQQTFDEVVVKLRTQEPLEQQRFRASSIADCPRKIIFSMMNLDRVQYPRAKGTEEARGYKLMGMGTYIHSYIQEHLIALGALSPDDLEEKKRLVDEEYLFSGHCDGVLNIEGTRILLEIKTMNSKGFAYLKEPKQEHYYQAQAYLHFLEKIYGIRAEHVLFVYVDRNSDNLDFKTFWIMRDEKSINMILNKLKVMKEFLLRGDIYPIPPGYDPLDEKVYACRYCPFNTEQLCRSGKLKISEFPGAKVLAKG